MNFLKTTVIGGLVFLVPMVVLVLVIQQAFQLMRIVAQPMADVIPLDVVGGVALANLIAAAIVVAVCFVGGLLARTRAARGLIDRIESSVLNLIPGYTFIKGITSALSPEKNADLKPVLVSLDDRARVGLEVERTAGGQVAVYFPGSPNAWSGTVQLVEAGRVRSLGSKMMSVIDHAERLGRGTRDLLASQS